jgi:hypothetical protein
MKTLFLCMLLLVNNSIINGKVNRDETKTIHRLAH